ncbi:hypothetical protein [Allofournierella massiliensis]|uniref:hypothetical protein n=1 Tax=Allofournierella massiliensis TaxID=1650663 RepID=UPI00104E482C|nr:hypothetical protein [Fournierella massiliensis]
METISPKILEKVSSDPAFRKKWGLLLNFRFATAPFSLRNETGNRRSSYSVGQAGNYSSETETAGQSAEQYEIRAAKRHTLLLHSSLFVIHFQKSRAGSTKSVKSEK